MAKKNNNPLEVIHLKQLHALNGIPHTKATDEQLEAVALSQYRVSQYILQNYKLPVVHEAIDKDMDCIDDKGFCSFIRGAIFPGGLPHSFEDFNKQQKAFLYKYGGATSLLVFDLIPKLHKSITREILDAFFNKKIDRETLEERVIDNVKQASEQHFQDLSNNKIILVFGAAHDFRNECTAYGYNLTNIDTVLPTLEYTYAEYSKVIDEALEPSYYSQVFAYTKQLTARHENPVDEL
jgi:hypothetical protein